MPRHSRAWYWLSLLLLVGLSAAYARYRDVNGLYLRYQKSEQDVQRVRGELDARKQEETQLKRNVTGLSSDPVEWEAFVRGNQGLVREGEKVYRVELTPRPRSSQ